MSSPTHSTANGGPEPGSSASRPITPINATSGSPKVFTPSKNPPIPKSPQEYFCEQEIVKSPSGTTLIIRRGFRDNTYYEDNCSPDPEWEEQMYTEKLELIKKQIQIKNMAREIERLTFKQAELQKILDPTTAKIDALQHQFNELAAAYQSKLTALAEIRGAPSAPSITEDMSATDVLEARKAHAKATKLELEIMESEIEMLEAQILVDAGKATARSKVAEFEITRDEVAELTANLVNLKNDYQKSNLAWISKFSSVENTLGDSDNKDRASDLIAELEQTTAENETMKEQMHAMLDRSAASSDEIIAGLEQTIANGAVQNQAQAQEIQSLKAIILSGEAQVQALHAQNYAQALEIQSLSAYITQAQKQTDANMYSIIQDLESKILDLEGCIGIMKPLYRIGRQVRYRNNYSLLRKDFEGQDIECNLDLYEEGYHARFGGNAIADSMMYSGHGGFDETKPMGDYGKNFDMLHYGITAKMVWDHRNDFTMLAEILDMASNMKAYGTKRVQMQGGIDHVHRHVVDKAALSEVEVDDSDAEDKYALVDFGHAKFKELFFKVISQILPHHKTLAIKSDLQFRQRQDLMDAFNVMYAISSEVIKNNYVARRKGAEETWEQPWENAWEEWDDCVLEAIKHQMF